MKKIKDQFNNKHTKIAVKATIQLFEKSKSKEFSDKSLTFFSLPITKPVCFKIFVKLNRNYNLMTKIFEFHRYQTFGLIKMHNIRKTRLVSNIFSL